MAARLCGYRLKRPAFSEKPEGAGPLSPQLFARHSGDFQTRRHLLTLCPAQLRWNTRCDFENLRVQKFFSKSLRHSITVLPMKELAQSVQRFATYRTVRGSNPGWGHNFRTRPDRAWGPPGLLYNGYWVFPKGKAAGAWR